MRKSREFTSQSPFMVLATLASRTGSAKYEQRAGKPLAGVTLALDNQPAGRYLSSANC